MGTQKYLERWRALGSHHTATYYLGAALAELAGIEVDRVYEWRAGEQQDVGDEEAHDSFEIITQAEALTADDRARLHAYGGASLRRAFAQAFRDNWRCLVARDQGELVSVCWLAMSTSFEAAPSRPCWLLQRCFTMPEQRGRGHYRRALRHAAMMLTRETPEWPIMVECSVWNVSSSRAIEKGGFQPVGLRIQVAGMSQFFADRRPTGNQAEPLTLDHFAASARVLPFRSRD